MQPFQIMDADLSRVNSVLLETHQNTRVFRVSKSLNRSLLNKNKNTNSTCRAIALNCPLLILYEDPMAKPARQFGPAMQVRSKGAGGGR